MSYHLQGAGGQPPPPHQHARGDPARHQGLHPGTMFKAVL